MRALISLLNALSDESRLRIVCALTCGELCVCQIQEMLGLAHSTTSKHLAVLADARIVDTRRQGRWAYYRLADEETRPGLRQVLAWLCREASGERQVAKDRQLLERILALPPEELIRLQDKGIACCDFPQANTAARRGRKPSPGTPSPTAPRASRSASTRRARRRSPLIE